MENNILYVARPGFVVRDIVGEHVLIPVETGNIVIPEKEKALPEFNGMITLNDLGLFLWNALSEPKSFNDLLEAVQREYEITDKDDPKQDIEEFLSLGITNQLIFLTEAPDNQE